MFNKNLQILDIISSVRRYIAQFSRIPLRVSLNSEIKKTIHLRSKLYG